MRYGWHILIAGVAVFTLLWRIDGTVLWRDEATTACWAREMVERRQLVPRVFNGERLIAQAPDGHDFSDSFLPAMQGWLQFYVAALGFLLGGVGTVQARLPFVLAGAAALWVMYRIGRNPMLPLLAATSIYFLTAARQAYVAAKRSSRLAHPPNRPPARSATSSCRQRAASNRG